MIIFIITILLTATTSTVISYLLYQKAIQIRNDRLERQNRVKFQHYNTFISPKPIYLPIITEV